MNEKHVLLLMTAIAVVSDSLLHPFYPQYLARVYSVTDPRQVGLYIAMCSLTVIAALPLWARVSRRIPVLRLLICAQLLAALLSVACWQARSLLGFCWLSVGMLVFKASYLLIYPYLMSFEDKERHLGTISLLGFVLHFGNVSSALLSGALLELLDPRWLMLAMAAGDLLQAALCSYLVAIEPSPRALPDAARADAPAQHAPTGFIYKLGLVMLVMYFSAYLSEPFFSSYWQNISGSGNALVTATVFAIPAATALAGLFVNKRLPEQPGSGYSSILPAIALGFGSLWLQASGGVPALVLGRCLYGWALFQAMVRLDALLFERSSAADYGLEFSKINAFQGCGVLSASYLSGTLVASFGLRAPFVIAAGGLLLGALLYGSFFRAELWPRAATEFERNPERVT